MASPRSHPNFLAGPYLNRVAEWRKDEARLRAAFEDPNALIVPIWRTRNLVAQTDSALAAHFFTGPQALGGIDPTELIFLGEFRSHACFALELDAQVDPRVDPP